MAIIQTVEEQLARLGSFNRMYNYNRTQWKYLLTSYLGGDDYRRSSNLTRYELETDIQYTSRLASTPCPNHCKSIVSVYNSFLFKEPPDRDFGSIANLPEMLDFLADSDRDGRNLDQFIKEVATWASVFGHCWIVMSKPNLGAVTRADEIAMDLRPYVTLMNPLSVLDWRWTRTANGSYELKYLKYVEEIDGSVQTIKEWTPETIETWIVDFDTRIMQNHLIEPNGFGAIPAVIAYNSKSSVRGLGISDIADIADWQRYVYNMSSEVEQTIRLDSHPSLVKTPETQAGAGAGSIIHMPDNMDPALKPYLLEYNGGSMNSIFSAINHSEELIDKLANTGGVRNVKATGMSGIALQVEFQLLGAKLAEKANNLEQVENALWELFCQYQGYAWDGYVCYPNEFTVTSQETEYTKLQMAKTASSGPVAQAAIDARIMALLNQDTAAGLEIGDESETDTEVAGEFYGVESAEEAASEPKLASDETVDPIATPDRIRNTPDVAPTMTRAGTNPGSTISQVGGSKNMTTTRIKAADANRFGR